MEAGAEGGAGEAANAADESAAELRRVEDAVATRVNQLEEELAEAAEAARAAEERADALAAELAASVEAGAEGVAGASYARTSASSTAVVSTTTSTTLGILELDGDAQIAPLSKMKKSELIEELVARGLRSDGIVAELRQRLRDARKGVIRASARVGPATNVATRAGKSGESYYQVIGGVRYDREVLDECRRAVGDDGRIDLEEARLVVMDVMDGPYKMQGRGVMSSVTDVEIATLEYAGELFEWTDEARAWVFGDLLDKMVRGVAGEDDVRGVSYYQVIGGVRYDRKVLDDCRKAVGDDGLIDLEEARLLVMDVMDGPYKMQGRGVMSCATDVEIATLEYAGELFEWTDEARAWVFDELFDKMVHGVGDDAREDDFSDLEIPEERRAAPRKASEANEPVKVIGGVRYDRKVLDDCRKAAGEDGRTRADAARRVVAHITETREVTTMTEVEIETLRYAGEVYGWTDEAKAIVEEEA